MVKEENLPQKNFSLRLKGGGPSPPAVCGTPRRSRADLHTGCIDKGGKGTGPAACRTFHACIVRKNTRPLRGVYRSGSGRACCRWMKYLYHASGPSCGDSDAVRAFSIQSTTKAFKDFPAALAAA